MIEQYIGVFGPSARLISEVLIHSLWQGSLIAAVLGLSVFLLKYRSAQLRYLLSCVAMVMILVSGVVTGVYLGITTDPEIGTSSMTAVNLPPDESDAVATEAMSGSALAGTASISGRWLESVPFSGWLFPLWVLGVLLLSVYHIFGWRKTRMLVTAGADKVPPQWEQRFSRLCRKLQVDRAVRLVSSTVVSMPCVIGWMKPVVLVPLSSFTGLAARELELILLHELAHIRRLDVLVGYVQTLLETLFFFHPAVWWVSRQIRIEREHCCDDMVVECSGDKLSYVRALTSLEERRTVRPGYAAAADGTPLLQRVRRLMGKPAGRNAQAGIGVAGIFVVVALVAFGLSFAGTNVSAEAVDESGVEKVESFRPEADDIEGDWEMEVDGKYSRLTMSFGRRSETSFGITPSDLSRSVSTSEKITWGDVINETTKSFKIERDAGTFFYEGEFERDGEGLWGEGECYFRVNDGYVEHMQELGFRLGSRRKSLTMAMHNVTLKFVRGLIAAGYDDMSLDELIEAHIHDASPSFIDELDKLGYRNLDLDQLVEMRIHDVEPEFITELNRLGYTRIRADELVEMRIHDVDPEFIEELAELDYGRPSISTLVSMKIHDVDPEFVEEMAELGYERLSISKLVEFQIHDVSPSFIGKLAELGYRDLSPSKLVEFKIHDVTPRFIRQLKELGYDDILPSELVSMRIHDVTPSFIRKLRDRGEDDWTIDELIDYKIYHR